MVHGFYDLSDKPCQHISLGPNIHCFTMLAFLTAAHVIKWWDVSSPITVSYRNAIPSVTVSVLWLTQKATACLNHSKSLARWCLALCCVISRVDKVD